MPANIALSSTAAELHYISQAPLQSDALGDKCSSDLKRSECQSHPEHFLHILLLTQFLRARCGNLAQSDSGQDEKPHKLESLLG